MGKMSDKLKAILALSALGVLFFLTSMVLFFCRMGDYSPAVYLADFRGSGEFFIGLVFLLAFLVCLTFTAYAYVNFFVFKKNKFTRLKVGALINLISVIVMCVASVSVNTFVSDSGGLGALFLMMLAIGLYIFIRVFAVEQDAGERVQTPVSAENIRQDITRSGQTLVSIIIVCVMLVALFINSCVLLSTPLYLDTEFYDMPTISQIFSFFAGYDTLEKVFCIMFVVMLVGNFIFLISVALKFFTNTLKFLRLAKIFARYNIFLTIFVMAFSMVKMFIAKFNDLDTYFITYIGVIIAYILYTVMIIFSGRAEEEARARLLGVGIKKNPRVNKPWELIFILLMTAATFSMLFINLFTLDINLPTGATHHESANGIDILTHTNGGFQNVIAFAMMLSFITSVMFLVFTFLNYITDSENYKQAALQHAYANLSFQFFYLTMGLFYVLMVPSMDSLLNMAFDGLAQSLLGSGASLSLLEFVKTKTLAYVPFAMGFVLLVAMQVLCFRRKRAVQGGAPRKRYEADELSGKAGGGMPSTVKLEDRGASDGVDPCPAFSEIDGKIPQYRQDFFNRRTAVFNDLSLKALAEFVVEFAKNTPERLSYSKDHIATFIAGLGASRLSILQGMSGTGKTSLPRVFMQAINGNCELIEVESSWRDKNELLGYFNEFNGRYTPKKFTQALYKASLVKEVPTFIVLDEMNLSRIEYYFSDFLSVMESSEESRAVKLVDAQIYPPQPHPDEESAEALTYSGLTGGNTIKIPPNVWFVGTANRDESTFEISDKVYDRAQTINFDRRAPKVTSKRVAVHPRFIEYQKLNALFEEARKTEFNAETDPLVIAVEKILAPYKISFGNRILKQIEDFVKVYMACYDTSAPDKRKEVLQKAIENIMFSKVLRKLELKIIDNKAQLAENFDKLNCKLCADFIRSLADN